MINKFFFLFFCENEGTEIEEPKEPLG